VQPAHTRRGVRYSRWLGSILITLDSN